ncbi:hypothetical protein [Pseudomonas sp. 8BK]|uniref:hypothetical protein n=1 Tax=Pseudomonas sp. 8BK TaxID=2653164 RepID=UPI00135B5AAB|nr:hypothetical protein [Pseudomonas sp. 8BK]
MLSIPDIGASLIFLALFAAILKESWWDRRPSVVQRRKDQQLGRALSRIADEAAKIQAARQSGCISQEHYEELTGRLRESEKDARIWHHH